MRKQEAFESKSSICQKIAYNPELIEPSGDMNILSQSEAVQIRARSMLPSFTFSADLIKSLQNHIARNQPKDGILFGTYRNKNKRPLSFCLEYLNFICSSKEQDIGFKIDQQECFCAVFALNKMNNQKTLDKFQYEIAKCRMPQPFKKGPVNEEPIMDEIEKIYFQLLRPFFVFQKDEEVIHRIIYFPNVNIRLREYKLKIKYETSQLLSKITQETADATVLPTFGYLVPNQNKRIMVVERYCKNCQSWPLMGVWIYAKNFKKPGTDEINPDKQHLVWALITDYIRRSKLKKVSMFGENRGVFILFTPGGKPTLYIFQCPQQKTANRWALAKSSSKKADFKQQSIYDTLIVEDELNNLFEPTTKQLSNKQLPNKDLVPLRKQVSSPLKSTQPNQPPRRQLPSFSNNSDADSRSDKASQKSYDEKDFQIRVLKDRLQFYKTRTQQLQKMLLNCQQLNPMMFMMNAMGQMNPNMAQGLNPMPSQQTISQMMGQFNPMNSQLPNHIGNLSQMPQFYPLYKSAVSPQQMIPQYASTPQHNAMSQSYVVAREQLPSSALISQAEEQGMDFTKKQNTINSRDINSACVTPMNKLTSSQLVMNKPEAVRMNLADQFSQGGSPTVSNNENNNSTNKPSFSAAKQQLIENSPKFTLTEQSQIDISKDRIKQSFNSPSIQDLNSNNFEISFKGYQAERSLDLPEPSKVLKKEPEPIQYRNSFLDSCASDTEYHFGSDLVKQVDRKTKIMPDSDSEDEEMNMIKMRWQGKR